MDLKVFKRYLRDADFEALFIDELGWNNPRGQRLLPLITIDEKEYSFNIIAERNGFQVMECYTDNLPATTLCRRIDYKLRRQANDYICIFIVDGTQRQEWMVPVKKTEKRDIVTCEYDCADKAIFLYQKISGFTFGMDEHTTIEDVKERVHQAFFVNSEKITKKFYAEFKKQHKAFVKFIVGIESETDCEWYTSIMLNRLMFCYFVQKKNFFDNDVDYLQHKLAMVKSQEDDGTFYDFYRDFLVALFHDGLNSPVHSKEFEQKFGRIPYLNGGMFDVHMLESKYPDIDIPDEAFANLFAFFDQWHWHLSTRITDSGNDINPDVLGYIFEQYINDRAQMGAYYTKEDITEYISRNTILPYLIDETERKGAEFFKPDGYVWSMLRKSGVKYIFNAMKHGYTEDWQQRIPDYISNGIDTTKPHLLERRAHWNEKTPEPYCLPTEIWRETIDRFQRCDEIKAKIANAEICSINDFITYNLDIVQFCRDIIDNATIEQSRLVKHFYAALQHITILDPTCGSGAFLFAAMNILEPLYSSCIERMQTMNEQNSNLFVAELGEINKKYRSNVQYFIYKSIILRNLYGVDIMKEAVEIAKLRLFLKMVAEVEVDLRADNLGLDPLPDIDFNIRCGNTLVGYATEKELDTALLEGDMFAAQAFKTEVYNQMDFVSKVFNSFRNLQLTQNEDSIEYKQAKHELQIRLQNLNLTLNKYMYKSIMGRDVADPDNDESFKAWLSSHQPFHWLAEFYEIINGNGGFDVIIGNPPYVVYTKKDRITKKSVSDLYSVKGYSTLSCNNLYAFVLERSISIIHDNSVNGMIIPISSFSNDQFVPLQNIMMKNGTLWLSSFSNRPGKLFPDVEQRLTILLFQYRRIIHGYYTSSYNHWYVSERDILFSRLSYCFNVKEEKEITYNKVGNIIQSHILNKLLSKSNKSLGSLRCLNGESVFYHNGPTYFIRSIPFMPNSGDGMVPSSHYKQIICCNNFFFSCILNSSLYYWFYKNYSNCRDYSDREINPFPIGDINLDILNNLGKLISSSYKQNRVIKNRNYNGNVVYYEEYYPSKSKPIIDEIDKVLAKHYGFTEEELDFIINYDIKYRMGEELNGTE
ncbi:MAG: Eco57I restriction-modification methylase domain-containing protein [Prevotella sp.]|nr:Eco57I restriction-modification methylase domain-containing protein [Prevotella sp.]